MNNKKSHLLKTKVGFFLDSSIISFPSSNSHCCHSLEQAGISFCIIVLYKLDSCLKNCFQPEKGIDTFNNLRKVSEPSEGLIEGLSICEWY